MFPLEAQEGESAPCPFQLLVAASSRGLAVIVVQASRAGSSNLSLLCLHTDFSSVCCPISPVSLLEGHSDAIYRSWTIQANLHILGPLT